MEKQEIIVKSKKCLVTGATGVIGVPLVKELAASGHDVKVLVRNELPEELILPSVKAVRGDLKDKNALASAAENAEWIFHLAAKLHINNPGENLKREYDQTNVNATERLIELASRNDCEKFIFFSTINVYGASQSGVIFDESSLLHPDGIYAESKAAAEKAVLSARNQSGKQFGVCLRLAAVYGSRMKGNYIRLLDAVRRGRFFFIGDASNRRTLIHQADVVEAAILAAKKAQGGSVYNVTDGEIHTLREIVEAMSRSLNKEKPRIQLPLAPIKLGVGAAEAMGNLFGIKSPVSRALLDKFVEDIAVNGDKIQRELNFKPRYDLSSGWQETISNLRLQLTE